MAEAVLKVSNYIESFFAQELVEFLAEFSVDRFKRSFSSCEKIGQVENLYSLVKSGKSGG